MGGTVPVCLQAPRDQRGADNFCFASGLTSINHTHKGKVLSRKLWRLGWIFCE
jgi:hypothetical protein